MKTKTLGEKMISKHVESDLSPYGEIKGKLRWNLECGSAQPSLFSFTDRDIWTLGSIHLEHQMGDNLFGPLLKLECQSLPHTSSL